VDVRCRWIVIFLRSLGGVSPGRRAYKRDFTRFAEVLGRESSSNAHHEAVTYWEKYMRDVDGLEPSTIRRKLSALSSLFYRGRPRCSPNQSGAGNQTART
jgi:hypothetical protein